MNKRVIAAGGALLILLTMIVGCAPASPAATEATQAPTEEPSATPTKTPTLTNTPKPSNTPKPTATNTPKPSDTPKPTATKTQKPTQETTTAAPATTEVTTGPTVTQQGAAELVPPGQTIWVLDTTASEHGSAAECPAPFQADFYGLVAINTIDNGITWMRAQDGITYTLLRQSPNVYWGTGASIYPGYTLTISVVFASPTGLGATFVLIDQAVQGCNHYWKYGGTLR